MTWVGIALLLVILYFALKVVGFVLKFALWALLLFGAYWLVAPYLSLPRPFAEDREEKAECRKSMSIASSRRGRNAR